MNKKTICILIALLLVCCLVFALAACATEEPNNGTEQGGDNGNGGNSGQTGDNTNPGGDNGNSGGNGGSGTGNSGDNSGGNGGNASPVSANLTPRYNISFYTGEADTQASQVEKVLGIVEGTALAAYMPEDPARPRYNFGGWYLDPDYQQVFDFATATMPKKNLCVYAKWDPAVSSDAIAQYEADLAANTQDGHLYIHYYRRTNTPESYEPLNLWIWPYQQTGVEWDWVRDANGNIVVDEMAGAYCDFDLTVRYDNAGDEKTEQMQFLVDSVLGTHYTAGAIRDKANYKNERVGFLIVYESSKNEQGHWRSDGNADHLFYIQDALWDNNSLHIFCTQDYVSEFSYHLGAQSTLVDPYEGDDGSHVSKANVNSSQYIKAEYGTNLTDTVSGVGYQIMVASFADSDDDGLGDIRGIINHLDYLRNTLHVDVLWLTPIQLSDSYHGYDIIDYKVVDPKFGSLADYKELLEACHERGMRVIMDLVLNHTSTNNVWFQKSTKLVVENGVDYRDFYQWRNWQQAEASGAPLSDNWYKYSEYAYSYYGKFSPSMPELNYDNQATRDAIVDVAKYWLGLGVDGFRIDAVKHIYMADEVEQSPGDIVIADYDEVSNTDYSSNLTKNLNFFTYFANEIKSEYRNCYLVGENFDGHAYNVAPYYTAYDGMLDFYMYYNLGELATYPGKAGQLAGGATGTDGSLPKSPEGNNNNQKLREGEWDYEALLGVQSAYSKDGIAGVIGGSGNGTVMGSLFTSNHDIARLVNNCVRVYTAPDKWTAQQIDAGNAEFAKTYALSIIRTMMTLPGISWVYYGDELGMSSNFAAGENKDSPHADRQFRQPYKWTTNADGDSAITHYSISGAKTYSVEWDAYNATLPGVTEQLADDKSFLNEVIKWTKLKSTDPVLRYGDYHYWQIDSVLFSYTRSYNGVTYKVITNYNTYDYMLNGSILGGCTYVAGSPGASLTYLPPGGTIVAKVG